MEWTGHEVLRPAGAGDVGALMALRAEAEEWLAAAGVDQWSDTGLARRAVERWRQAVDEGRTWVVGDADGTISATVSRGPADRDFWGDGDRPESGFYLCKLIVARRAAGRRLGARIVDWAARVAAVEGRDWVRVDVWRTNHGLQRYYADLGFRHVRTEAPPHRRSGWLAQRPVALVAHPEVPLAVRGCGADVP
ncbi:GNAT family N-acetyltransferase [Streptomyces sp. NPDC002004]